MLLPRLRRSRRSLVALLALVTLLTATQLGLLATSARAEPQLHLCSPEWAERELATGTGINIIERCEPHPWYFMSLPGTLWDWAFLRFKPADQDKRVIAKRYSSSPPYSMKIQGIFGGGTGGGAAGGNIRLTNPDGTPLNRRIAARAIIEVQPNPSGGFQNCRDSGWKESSSASWKSAWFNQYTQPDCGKGYYRAQVAGRFWSVSLNKWITSQWHYTTPIWVDGPPICCVATEPTVTPTPHVESPEDP
jgi:hypothetical protein